MKSPSWALQVYTFLKSPRPIFPSRSRANFPPWELHHDGRAAKHKMAQFCINSFGHFFPRTLGLNPRNLNVDQLSQTGGKTAKHPLTSNPVLPLPQAPCLAHEAVEVEDGSGWGQGENRPNARTATLTTRMGHKSPELLYGYHSMVAFFNNVWKKDVK